MFKLASLCFLSVIYPKLISSYNVIISQHGCGGSICWGPLIHLLFLIFVMSVEKRCLFDHCSLCKLTHKNLVAFFAKNFLLLFFLFWHRKTLIGLVFSPTKEIAVDELNACCVKNANNGCKYTK